MHGEQAAILRRPPRGNGTGDKGETFTQAVGVASTAAVAVDASSTEGGNWYTFESDTDCHIRFGHNLAAGPTPAVAAATASDLVLFAGVPQEWWCDARMDSHFRVIRKTADGTLWWHASAR